MHKILSKEEVELEEVRSELTFTQSEFEMAREEANIVVGKVRTAQVEVELA